jgi:hypothetical protein
VKGRLSYDPETFTVTFTPYRGLLRRNTSYKVILSSGITDLSGNPFAGYAFSFRTGN